MITTAVHDVGKSDVRTGQFGYLQFGQLHMVMNAVNGLRKLPEHSFRLGQFASLGQSEADVKQMVIGQCV